MRICLISNMYPSAEDPTFGIFVQRMEDGWDRIPGVTTVRRILRTGRSERSLKNRVVTYLRLMAESWSAAGGMDHDLIYAHFLSWHLLPFAVRSPRRPLFVHLHGSDLVHAGHLLRLIQHRIIRRSAAVVVPSRYFADQVRREFGDGLSAQIIVSPSGGISEHFFDPCSTRIESGPLRIGFVSTMTRGKGWGVFLSALKLIQQRPDWVAEMVGSGPDEDRCRSEIRRHFAPGRIEWSPRVPPNRLRDVFARLDVLVFPSVRSAESLGLVPLEAMAAGVHVIASRQAAMPEYVQDGVNGDLTRPGDDRAIAVALGRLLDTDVGAVRSRRERISQSVRSYRRPEVMARLIDDMRESIPS